MYQVYNDEYLMHHGIKGQRWGIRRYQNKDGSLTSAGARRYGKKMAKYESKKAEAQAKLFKLRAELSFQSGNARKDYYSDARTTRARSLVEDPLIKKATKYENKVNEMTNALFDKFGQKGYDEVRNYAINHKAYVDSLIKMHENRRTYMLMNDYAASRGAWAANREYYQSEAKRSSDSISDLKTRLPKSRPQTLNIGSSDSSVTKKVKADYNSLSDSEFSKKYSVTKEVYAKRVQKYGDPYMNSPLAKIGKKLSGNQNKAKTTATASSQNAKARQLKIKSFVDTNKPSNNSSNTLKDIDDLDLIDLYIDDPSFRKEYGVSDDEYRRYKKEVG